MTTLVLLSFSITLLLSTSSASAARISSFHAEKLTTALSHARSQDARQEVRSTGIQDEAQQEPRESAVLELSVQAKNRSEFKVPAHFSAVGVEFLNHEFYGGLYSQLIFGESFEEQPNLTATMRMPPPGSITQPPSGTSNEAIRSTGFIFKQGYLATGSDLAVMNSSLHGAEQWCSHNPDCCGFTFPGAPPHDPSSEILIHFKLYCQFFASPTWSTFMKPAPKYPPAQQGFIGCWSRSNNHTLLQGVSEMWLGVVQGDFSDVQPTFSSETMFPMNGQRFQRITWPAPTTHHHSTTAGTRVGVANHGLNCQHGLSLVGGKAYEGLIYLKTTGDKDLRVRASLEDSLTGAVLASQGITVKGGADWTRYDLSLIPASSTTCPGITKVYPHENFTENLASCTGSFVVSLEEPGVLDIDYTFFSAAAWDLQHSETAGSIGLPARGDVSRLLQLEGLKYIRMGGSMCNHGPYRWKDFIGPRQLRQPYAGDWYRQPGLTQSRGFGLFETADLAEALDMTVIVTVNDDEKPDDMADFVEYCWGDNTTNWGRQRIAHGHPLPYNITHVEIGNEVPNVELLADHVGNITLAMEARAKAIGAPLFTYYIGHNEVDAEVANKTLSGPTKDMISRTRHLGDRVLWDVHVGAEPDSVAMWERFFIDFQRLVKEEGSELRAVVLEENGGDHGLLRGIGHAVYGNMMQRHADFVQIHGYANGLEAWQGMDREQMFSQGQIFILPNMTFPQPTWHVISMMTSSYQPRVLSHSFVTSGDEKKGGEYKESMGGTGVGPVVGDDVYVKGGVRGGSSGPSSIDAIAVGSEDEGTVVVRVANWGEEVQLKVTFEGTDKEPSRVLTTVLEGHRGFALEENTPSNPTNIVPKTGTWQKYTSSQTSSLKPLSFTVLQFEFDQAN